MTLNIEVSGKYRITSDDRQIVIQRKHTVDPTKSPAFNAGTMSAEPYDKWSDWKYCGSPEVALSIIAKQNVFESDATDLCQLRNEIVEFNREIRRLIGVEV